MKKSTMALLLLGILIGSTGTTLYVTRDLDSLHDQVKALTHEKDQLIVENELLSAQIQSPEKNHPLKAIRVDCTTPTDLAVQTAIKNRVLKDLSFLQGKPQDVLLENPKLPSYILDDQFMYIDNRKFRLAVTLVIIAHDELYIQVRGRLDQ
ncbi:hypothetical protein [Alicyclobacillus dauci]|uniref:Uncharacterized protein n=1 Tax=Alicyclobacillus dauci TaxID=1475485 RepID=A0ABY6YZB4_9BACL|nr:hypothetical protein [Alicyclobacillus dauci]WAH35797.1 hypothetical protein NZD86_16185 [Alicyclobacillus dauci]